MRMLATFLLLVSIVGVSLADDSRLEVVVLGKSHSFSRAELEQALATHTLTVADPDHDRPLVYDAFALSDVLALAGAAASHGDELVFQARDGYAPTVPFGELGQHPAYVAYREHGNPDGFGLVAQGKAMVSPAPYFLLWQEGKSLGPGFPWPYQLVRIELVDFATKYAALYPRDMAAATRERRGFATFKIHCLRCHSINLQGGDLGPELNVPKNITEYWPAAHLHAFIQDASSYRARSKMPSFAKLLTSDEVDDLTAYLTLMKSRKSPSAE